MIAETDPLELNLNVSLVRQNNWQARELIYAIPLRNSVKDIVIKPESNLTRAMTVDSKNSAILQNSFEFPEQRYTIIRGNADVNSFVIKQSSDNKFLSWDGGSKVHFDTASSTGNNLWRLNYLPSLRKNVITNRINDNIALDVPGSVTDNGNELIMYTRHNGANQRFMVAGSGLGERIYIVSMLDQSKVLSASNDHHNAIIYNRDTGPLQAFVLIKCDYKGDNVYQIINDWTNLVLAWNVIWTVPNGSHVFFHKNESYKDEYYWILNPQRDGGYIISNFRDPNRVLDVANAATANGTRLQLIHRNGNRAQLFTFLKNPETSPAAPLEHNKTAIIRTTQFANRGDYVFKVSNVDAILIIALRDNNDHLERFNFFRARGKGPCVY
ncbi:RICIN domain-containing protein [Erwinia tracheiphila]|uniref:Ricin B lectin domain-containing protein n=1 Tax=Erwinia tracheiphila TaxID=65700 RepID=A0A0M2KJP1_9GAMM|nr:RICIN domain-containing protein [Erwinia tracheiphila]EOS95751.1 toxin [Erwinia tracheiphila PSU-1]KKF37443.1 hypothetical protein SY86_21805 [Erwinia tracheiphila]UIA88839.1 RICIN domain-containing protein [Erwinia tracheiphila]UIA97220.1 RICIN domain-containing protein [Erwinia tracheiphila]